MEHVCDGHVVSVGHPEDSPLAVTVDSVVGHGVVQWALAGAEVVVRVPALAATHVLDPTSAVLWQCLDGVSPLSAVFDDIAEAFGVAAEQVAADCLPVIGSWLHASIASMVQGGVDGAAASWPVVEPSTAGRTWRRLVDPPNT